MKWLELASASFLVSLTIAVVAIATDPLPSHRIPRPLGAASDDAAPDANGARSDSERDSPRPGLPGGAEYERKQADWEAARDAATGTSRNRNR